MTLIYRRGYTCYAGGGVNYEQVCISADAAQPLTNVWLASGGWPVTQTSFPLTTITAPQVVLNDGIPVAWQATDSAILALLSPAAGTTIHPDPTTPPAPGSSSTSIPSMTSSKLSLFLLRL